MRLYTLYSSYNKRLKDEWFLPSLPKDIELRIKKAKSDGGEYLSDGFKDVIIEKSRIIISAIEENMGGIFIYSDVDIQFFRPIKSILLKEIQKYDIVCMRDGPGEKAELCTGFFIIKASNHALRLWRYVRKCIEEEGRDQFAFNRIIRRLNYLRWSVRYLCPKIKYNYLPSIFFGGGTLTGSPWKPGLGLPVPEGIVLHHANWTVGIDNKIAQLKYVRNVVQNRTVK